MADIESEIRRRIELAIEEDRPVEGVLFHATGVDIGGPLRPCGDGVLWTARCPFVAQQYIPASGVEALVSVPDFWRLDSRVSPDQHDTYASLASRISGLECDDIEWDFAGRAKSFRCPAGWPRYREVVAFIQNELGYVADNGMYRVKEHAVDGQYVVMPADWSLQGRVFMALDDGLRFKDIRLSGESDLCVKEHMGYDAFEEAAREGWDGVIINDFCQTDDYGNVGHLSFGIGRESAAAVEWISAEARRCQIDPLFDGARVTDAVREWLEMARLHAGMSSWKYLPGTAPTV